MLRHDRAASLAPHSISRHLSSTLMAFPIIGNLGKKPELRFEGWE